MGKALRVAMAMKNFNVGGVQTYVYTVTKTLLELGVSVLVVAAAPTGPLLPKFAALGCDVRGIDAEHAASLPRSLLEEGVSVINAHHADVALLLSGAAAAAGIPLVFTVHYRGDGNLALKSAVSHYVSVSPALQAWLRANGIESVVVPNAIDTERFRDRGSGLRSVCGIDPGVPVLAYASRLHRKKGEIGKLVLEAFDRELAETFPEAHLLMAGDGADAEWLSGLARKSRHASRIHTLGYVEQMPEFYSAASVVVGTGRIALEAMSCERVVVAVGVKGDVGLVTPPLYDYAWRKYYGDHGADWRPTAGSIAGASRIALSSPSLRSEWGRRGREEMIRRFDRLQVARILMRLYERVRREGDAG
ncbi:glycosyltransferase [Paenibacillus sp.]|uniref:glycosyltransferase n=1 Tax=Paenibacillus sp. TaxID=58172 RepID=UPI002810FCA2|nr:glycosyltransferase [Paenibacillus sp.]